MGFKFGFDWRFGGIFEILLVHEGWMSHLNLFCLSFVRCCLHDGFNGFMKTETKFVASTLKKVDTTLSEEGWLTANETQLQFISSTTFLTQFVAKNASTMTTRVCYVLLLHALLDIDINFFTMI